MGASISNSESGQRRRALFFDRDGVLNEDLGFVHKPEEFRWVPGAKEAISWLNQSNYLVFVVTNQSGIARGYYGPAEVEALHHWMQGELAAIGAHIDQFAYCPHHPEAAIPAYRQACACRKPRPGMILDLLGTWPVDAARSLLIGDQRRDLEAAQAAGIRAVCFSGGNLHAFVRDALLKSEQM
jgi:D-glycero-D-manno-heptose 1,7-bisphosphate phosphatase